MCIVFPKNQKIRDTRFVQSGTPHHDSVKSRDILAVPFVIDVAPRDVTRKTTETSLTNSRASASTFFTYHREFVNVYGIVAIYG